MTKQKLTIGTFKSNLRGTAGIQAAIAQNLEVTRSAVTKFLNKNPKMRILLEDEAERALDKCENVIEGDINNVSSKSQVDTAKWKLLNSKRGKNRGYGPKTEVDQTIQSDNKIEVEIIEVSKKEDADSDSETPPE